jgi:hypothetical protein
VAQREPIDQSPHMALDGHPDCQNKVPRAPKETGQPVPFEVRWTTLQCPAMPKVEPSKSVSVTIVNTLRDNHFVLAVVNVS